MKHHNLSDTQKFENDQHKNRGYSNFSISISFIFKEFQLC